MGVRGGRQISNLALTGFMGVGKSSLGRHIAGRLNFDFVDTDAYIEKCTGQTIQKIFETEGEQKFRQLERSVLLEAAHWHDTVISTGGGLVTYLDNMQLLKSHAFVVCLWANPDTIYTRTSRHSNRPLLQTDDPRATIKKLLDRRGPFYKQADLMVNTENRPLRKVGQLVIYQFKQFLKRQNEG